MGQTDETHLPELPDEMVSAFQKWRVQRQHCPQANLLQASRSGLVPPEVAEPVIRHWETCPTCKLLIENLDRLEEAPFDEGTQQRIWNQVEAAAGTTRGAEQPSWYRWLVRPWPLMAVLGAAAVAVIALVLVRERPGTVAPKPVAAKPAAPKTPLLALEKAPIVLPPAALLVWRGKPDDGAMWKELQAALLLYQSGDYAKASALLEPLTVKYPTLSEAWFYLGVCRLFLSRDDGAIRALEEARKLAKPALADQALWYLAVAYERAGKVPAARLLLGTLCSGGQERAARACHGLEALRMIQ